MRIVACLAWAFTAAAPARESRAVGPIGRFRPSGEQRSGTRSAATTRCCPIWAAVSFRRKLPSRGPDIESAR